MNSTLRIAKVRQMCQSGEARAIREGALAERGDLARDLGVHVSAVSRWETGDRLPRGETALQYLQILERLQRLHAETVA